MAEAVVAEAACAIGGEHIEFKLLEWYIGLNEKKREKTL